MVTFFTHIHIISTDTKSFWIIEFTFDPTPMAEVTQILAILTEHQDLAFVTISNENVSLSVKVYVHWTLELVWSITMSAK